GSRWWGTGRRPGGTRGLPGLCPRSGRSTPQDSSAPPPARVGSGRARTTGAAVTPSRACNRRDGNPDARAPARRRAATPASASARDHTPPERLRRSGGVAPSSSRFPLRFRGGGRRRVGLAQRIDLLMRPLGHGVPRAAARPDLLAVAALARAGTLREPPV